MREASRASFQHEVQSLAVAAAGEASVGVNPGSYSAACVWGSGSPAGLQGWQVTLTFFNNSMHLTISTMALNLAASSPS